MKKILLIDDEESIGRITKMNIERSGNYEVTLAFSGGEGLKKAGETEFDLVITDYRMPGIDGKAVLDALKKAKPDGPIVIFSIYHDDGSQKMQDVLRKADGVISKPIDREQILKVIEDALAGRRPGAR